MQPSKFTVYECHLNRIGFRSSECHSNASGAGLATTRQSQGQAAVWKRRRRRGGASLVFIDNYGDLFIEASHFSTRDSSRGHLLSSPDTCYCGFRGHVKINR